VTPPRYVGAATPLQTYLGAAFDLLEDARAELDDSTCSLFVAILTERIGVEAARLVVGGALRATRESALDDEAA
jgi:hypothetical protein